MCNEKPPHQHQEKYTWNTFHLQRVKIDPLLTKCKHKEKEAISLTREKEEINK